MTVYEIQVNKELSAWITKMQRKPTLWNKLSKKMQVKINSYIPEKIHNAITVTIKQMIRGVLFGASLTTKLSAPNNSLMAKEEAIMKIINFYKKTAAIEGGISGAGGILLGLADFPVLIGIKLKMLFEIAALYGFNITDYKERIYLLHIFELAFSSEEHRNIVFNKMINWEEKSKKLPEDINEFDWRNFQQEYRDYIDLAKMAQLIPIIGAPVGLLVNHRLVNKLGVTAMNAYRMRLFNPADKLLLAR